MEETRIKLSDVKIDFSNSSIPCGQRNTIWITVCYDDCSTGKTATENVSFTKDCAIYVSSSGGGTARSSSSEAIYKFGSKNDGKTAEKNETITIQGFSATFKLLEEDGTWGAISVNGGTISLVMHSFDPDLAVDPGPTANTPYPARDIPITITTDRSATLQPSEYYLIVADGGTNAPRYLIRVRPKSSNDYTGWPRPVEYWEVKEWPK